MMRSRSSWRCVRPMFAWSAITTVAGNVPVLQSTRNALYTVELCGANVPVYIGC